MFVPKAISVLSAVKKLLCLFWASPYTLLGVAIGCMGVLSGGAGRIRHGAIEFYGGFVAWFVRHLPTGRSTAGITLGHCILGQTSEGLVSVDKHERIHVRQFELWGPFMGPVYLLASAWLWIRGKDAYLENPFEVEAYRDADL